MESDEDILERLAKDGSMDLSWEIVLPGLLRRIEKIAHNEFPVPVIQGPPSTRTPMPRFMGPIPSSDPIPPPESAPSSQETDKENALPSSSVGVTSTPRSSNPFAAPGYLVQPPVAPGTLPGPIAVLLDEVTSTLLENFKSSPPHTVQRLAELVLHPKQHYRSLTAYLHALDRVVHVTSSNNIYPLPPAMPDMSQMSLLANGVGASGAGGLQVNTVAANSLGSDESLGGALLTPIPWLARRTNGGSEDGAGSSEDGSSSSPVGVQGKAATGTATPQQPAQQPQQQQQQQPPAQQTQPQSQPQPQPQPQPQRSAAAPATGPEKKPTTTPPTSRPQVRTESTETIEGPNGMGSIETVSVSINGVPSTGAVLASRGVTQGELLRQEQRAGVVPLNQLVRQAHHQAHHQQQQAQAQGGGGSSDSSDEQGGPSDEGDAAMGGGEQQEDDEVPHARGPSEIDDVDTGPQPGSGGATNYAVGSAAGGGQVVKMQGIDVEAAVGRKADPAARQRTPERGPSPGEEMVPRSPKREAEQELDDGGGKKVKVGEEGDGDVVMEAEGSGDDVVGGEGAKPEVEKDAEGDVVIRDPDPLPADGGEAGQGAEKA